MHNALIQESTEMESKKRNDNYANALQTSHTAQNYYLKREDNPMVKPSWQRFHNWPC